MTKEPNAKKLARPHNCYNIFFILERERLIQQAKEESSSKEKANDVTSNGLKGGEGSASSYDLVGYESLSLPDLPPRYHGLSMENGWYVPGKNARRKHVKTHGCKYTGQSTVL